MIREYRPEDASALLDLLCAPGGHVITNSTGVRQMLNENRVLVYDDGLVRGMASIEIGKEISQIILYTAPAERGKGIGSALWDAALRVVEEQKPRTLWAFYR